MEDLAKEIQLTMYYPDADVLISLREGSGCLNHSFEPNSRIIYNKENDPWKLYSITLRDIKAGEEITENYGNYMKQSGTWAEEYIKKYVPSRIEFEAEYGVKKISAE